MSYVTTLAFSSWPRQGHGKVQAKNATQESRSHSRECGRLWRNEPTHSQVDSHIGIWSLMDFSESNSKSQNTLDLGFPYIIENS
jgi:hypothetical protein